MAHFTYTRAGGMWLAPTTIEYSEFASLDAKTYKAINGDEGGSWAPSSAIIIGGAGLRVDGPFHVTTDGTIDGNLIVNGGAFVSGASNFSDNLNVQGNLGVVGTASATEMQTASLQADAGHIYGALVVDGTTTLNNTLSVTNGISIGTGGMVVNIDPVQLVDGASLRVIDSGTITSPTATITTGNFTTANAANLNVSNVAQIPRLRRRTIVVSGGATYTVADGNCFIAEGLVSDTGVGIDDTGAQDDESLEFSSTIVSGGSMLVNMPVNCTESGASVKNASGNFSWIRYTRIAGVWHRSGFTYVA